MANSTVTTLRFKLNVRLIVLDVISVNGLTLSQELERENILRLLKRIEKLKEEQPNETR